MKKPQVIAVIILITILVIAASSFVLKSTGQITSDITNYERSTKTYLFAIQKQASLSDNGEVNYYVNDHLGGTNKVYDKDGNQTASNEYYAYGEDKLETGVNQDFKFTGKQQDDSTGMYYYGARYYEPMIARFVAADSFKGEINNPQSLNRYAYTLNNPIKYTDPSGMKTAEDKTFILAASTKPMNDKDPLNNADKIIEKLLKDKFEGQDIVVHRVSNLDLESAEGLVEGAKEGAEEHGGKYDMVIMMAHGGTLMSWIYGKDWNEGEETDGRGNKVQDTKNEENIEKLNELDKYTIDAEETDDSRENDCVLISCEAHTQGVAQTFADATQFKTYAAHLPITNARYNKNTGAFDKTKYYGVTGMGGKLGYMVTFPKRK